MDGAVGAGLGPLFNARGCAECHPGGNRGDPAGPGLVLRLPDDPALGRQLQTRAVAGLEPEGRLEVRWEESEAEFGDGERVTLRRPVPSLPGSLRLAPPLRGVGLLARLPGPAGRFGRTGTMATLAEQVADALSLDLGIATPLRPGAAGDCTAAETACLALAGDRGVEAGADEVDALVTYVGSLRPRPAAPPDPAGAALFARFGCDGCHRPAYTIPADPADVGTTSETVRPYTDLRPHDLGDGLADVTTRVWRTAPLWALRDGGPLLHDGRAGSLLEAILWHGGEAQQSRESFRLAPPGEREALLMFLARL